MVDLDQSLLLASAPAPELPGESGFVFGAMVIAGLVLWLLGGKVIKPVFAILGMALGGLAGMVALPATGLEDVPIAGVDIRPEVLGLALGVIGGGLGALLLFRVVLSVSAAVSLAAAGAIGALVYLDHAPTVPAGEAAPASAAEDAARAFVDATEPFRDVTSEEIGRQLDAWEANLNADPQAERLSEEDLEAARAGLWTAAERSRALLSAGRDAAVDEWRRRPVRDRIVILGSTVGGLLIGAMAGLVFPKRSAAVVTALLGSAVWMASGVVLLRSMPGETPGFLNQPPQTWATVWSLVAFVGLTIQLGAIGRLTKRRGVARDDDDEDDD